MSLTVAALSTNVFISASARREESLQAQLDATHDAATVKHPSKAGIVGSYPIQDIHVRLRVVCVCVVLCRRRFATKMGGAPGR